MKPPYTIGSVPSLSGHAIAYRWRSLPRVRRHRASKPQGSSERVLLWQITMDQLIFASLSHTHYWYEVGMLKVPAVYAPLVHHRNVLWSEICTFFSGGLGIRLPPDRHVLFFANRPKRRRSSKKSLATRTSTLVPYSLTSKRTPTTRSSSTVPSLRCTQWISAECRDSAVYR